MSFHLNLNISLFLAKPLCLPLLPNNSSPSIKIIFEQYHILYQVQILLFVIILDTQMQQVDGKKHHWQENFAKSGLRGN